MSDPSLGQGSPNRGGKKDPPNSTDGDSTAADSSSGSRKLTVDTSGRAPDKPSRPTVRRPTRRRNRRKRSGSGGSGGKTSIIPGNDAAAAKEGYGVSVTLRGVTLADIRERALPNPAVSRITRGHASPQQISARHQSASASSGFLTPQPGSGHQGREVFGSQSARVVRGLHHHRRDSQKQEDAPTARQLGIHSFDGSGSSGGIRSPDSDVLSESGFSDTLLSGGSDDDGSLMDHSLRSLDSPGSVRQRSGSGSASGDVGIFGIGGGGGERGTGSIETATYLEFVRVDSDFEFFRMHELRYQAGETAFHLPEDHIRLETLPRKDSKYVTPGRIPQVDEGDKLLAPASDQVIHCLTEDWSYVDRKYWKRKAPLVEMIETSFVSKLRGPVVSVEQMPVHRIGANDIVIPEVNEKHIIGLIGILEDLILPAPRYVPPIAPIASFASPKVLVTFRQLVFDIGKFEPVFCTAALYHAASAKKISDDFHFHLNSMDLVRSYMDSEYDFSHTLVRHLIETPKTVFTVPNPSLELLLVVTFHSIFSSDARPYVQDRRTKSVAALLDQTRQIAHLSYFTQPFAVAQTRLFRKKRRRSGAGGSGQRGRQAKPRRRIRRIKSFATLTRQETLRILEMGAINETEVARILDQSEKSVNQDELMRRQRRQADLAVENRRREDAEMGSESVVLKEGVIELNMYRIPMDMRNFNVLDFLLGSQTKARKQNLIKGSVFLEVSNACISEFFHRATYHQMPEDRENAWSIKELNQWDDLLETSFHQCLPLYPSLPYTKLRNTLYIFPRKLNVATSFGGLGQKKEHLTLRILFRRDDSVPLNGPVDGERLICPKYWLPNASSEENYCTHRFASVVSLGDKKRLVVEFADEICLHLPLCIRMTDHLVFVFYSVDEEEHAMRPPPKPNQSGDEEEGEVELEGEIDEIYTGRMKKTPMGYAWVKILPYVSGDDTKILELPFYRDLHSGYLSEQPRLLRKMGRTSRRLSAQLRFVSAVNPPIDHIREVFRIIGNLLDALRSDRRSAAIHVEAVLDALPNIYGNILTLKARIVPHLFTSLHLLLMLVPALDSLRNDVEEIATQCHEALVMTTRCIIRIVQTHPRRSASFAQYMSVLPSLGENMSFTMALCGVLRSYVREGKSRRRVRGARARGRDSVKEEVPLDSTTWPFFLDLLIKSMLNEKESLTGNEDFSERLMKLGKLLITTVILGQDTKLNISAAYFVCDLFNGLFANNLLPMRLVHYYHMRATDPGLEDADKRNSLRLQLEFFRILVHHPMFLAFGHPLPFSDKSHCMIDIFISIVLVGIVNPFQMPGYDEKVLELFQDHLLELDLDPDNQGERRELIGTLYFPLIERLVRMNVLFVAADDKPHARQRKAQVSSPSRGQPAKRDVVTVDMFSRMRLKEKEKLSEILLHILVNTRTASLIHWIANSSPHYVMHFVRYLLFMMMTFARHAVLRPSETRLVYQCYKVVDLYRLTVDAMLPRLLGLDESTGLLQEMLRFSFALFDRNKVSVTIFTYYIKNVVRHLVERTCGILSLDESDPRWQRMLCHLVRVSKFPLTVYASPLVRDCIDLLCHIPRDFVAKQKPFQSYEFEEEIPRKNIILNDPDCENFRPGSVRAASLSKLVEYIVFKPPERNLSEEVFFVTHRSFVSTLDLLNMFFTLYDHECGLDETGERERKKQAVIDTLLTWMDKYFFTFTNSSICYLLEFLDRERGTLLSREHLQMIKGQLLASLRLNSTSRDLDVVEEEDDDDLAALRRNQARSLIPAKFKRRLDEVRREILASTSWKVFDDFILQWDPREIARQITLIEFDIFRRITPKEFFKKEEGDSPNLDALTTFFNQMTLWIQNSLLRFPERKARRDQAKKFISILTALMKLRNFNAMFEVVSAFQTAPVERLFNPDLLPKRYVKLGQKTYSTVVKASRILSHEMGYKRLRRALAKDAPAVPFLGLYRTDLVKIQVGNPDIVKMDYEGETYGLINVNKRRLISSTLQPLVRFQQYDLHQHFAKLPCLYDVLRELGTCSDFLGRDDILKLSLQYKPRR